MSKTEDEASELAEEQSIEEEEPEVFNSEDFISTGIPSDACTLPDNVIEFDFSYGYDCKRYYNLIAPDSKTLLFASGNLIHFFSVSEKRVVKFRRSAFGYGIGHITKNPNPEYQHIAVAENGINPPVIVYEWPSLDIVCLLRGGAERCFTHLDYSPDGELLASQAGEPDYLITIFDWPKKKILLRTKSYTNTVFNVKFSPKVPGQLTTTGMSHIKFWKIASTFTGLKLKGFLGRFGKTEYSDIVGVIPMPDEKVLSGCQWGNILVWDEGLIKVEVCRRRRNRCHEGAIMQMEYDTEKGEIWTASVDGRIRVWSYDAIDQADPPDDDRVFEIEPTYDFYTPDCQFMCYVKEDDNPENFIHFAQDGNGGIWRIDLNTDTPPEEPVQLYKCHAGGVADMGACPWGTYVATLGLDGRLFLYQYFQKQLVFEHQFPAKGRCMIWLPLTVEPSGDEIVMAFDDGFLRSIILSIPTNASSTISFSQFQLIKPHHMPITAMALNSTGKLLVTGSEDKTVFVFQIYLESNSYAELLPIGLVPVPEVVSCLMWFKNPDTRLIVGCYRGHFVQINVPPESVPYTKISYKLDVSIVANRFESCKSQIRRDIKIAEIEAKKSEKVERKRKEMQRLKKENPGLEIDEEVFLADSESEEELEPLFFPEIPNRILWMQHTPEDTIWLSMGGFDAGYIYEYKLGQTDALPFKSTMVNDGDDIEISSYLYDRNMKYQIFAMQDGALRINKVNEEDFHDLSDYWRLPMHDNFNGFIPKMCFSYDEKYMFSCGHDGNVFAYKWLPFEKEYKEDETPPFRVKKKVKLPEIALDELGYKELSLEQAMVKAEKDRIDNVANDHKDAILQKIEELKCRFENLLTQNSNLPPTQIIPGEELELDPRVTKDLKDKLEADLKLVARKLEFSVQKSELGMKKILAHFLDPLQSFPIIVRGINNKIAVRVLRVMKLSPKFYPMQEDVERRIFEEEQKSRPPERPVVQQTRRPPVRKRQTKMEYFLMGLSPDIVKNKLGSKLKRMLERYRQRKLKWEVRQAQWDQFNFIKPMKGVDPPEDVQALAHAEATIGNYKLKSDPFYKPPKQLRVTTVKKYKQFLIAGERQFNIGNSFNEKIFAMRQKKEDLIKFLADRRQQLMELHEELPVDCIQEIPPLPEVHEDDYLDMKFKVNVGIPKEMPEKSENIKIADKVVECPNLYKLQKEVLPEGRTFQMIPENVTELLESDEGLNVFESDFELLLNYTQLEDGTPWEQEANIRRVCLNLFLQNNIIEQMHTSVDAFDSQLHDLSLERYGVRLKACLLDIHMLTMHQELIVLKQFEAVEGRLSDDVNATLRTLIDMEETTAKTIQERTKLKESVEALQGKEKDINDQFYQIIQNNKFYDFLRRIFKKKYKPPKEHKEGEDSDSDSSSSSSSDESDEGDGESIDSRDFGIIRLDESVCPKGCDPTLFNLTYDLRSQRYDIEIMVREKLKQIDFLNKDIEMANKKLKAIENQLKLKQDELDSYQREKQGKLNQILDTVVLNMHQIQPFKGDVETAPIDQLLVISKKKLTELFNRVNDLQRETLEQRAKHRVNKSHMGRMITDLKLMEKQIHDVKRQIVDKMKIRFGQIIDIDELEEAKIMDSMHLKFKNAVNVHEMEEELLKSIIKDIKLSMFDVKGMYMDQIKFWKEKFKAKQKELLDTIKANTTRMNVLSLLKREKDMLAGALKVQPMKEEFIANVTEQIVEHKKEMFELSEVVRKQRKELEVMKKEIDRLRTKGLKMKPEEKFEFPKLETPEEEEEDEWLDYEEYLELFGDYYAELFKKDKERLRAATPERPIVFKTADTAKQSWQAAKRIIQDMLEATEIVLKDTTEKFVATIMEHIIKRASVTVLIDKIVENLQEEPAQDKRGVIETTAERLFSLQELEVTEADVNACTQELFEEIVDNALLEVGEPHEVILNMVKQLVEQVPYEWIQSDEQMEYLGKKISQSDLKIDKLEIQSSISSFEGVFRDEIVAILESILNALP